MSLASERKAMRDVLPLMSVQQTALFMGRRRFEVHDLIEEEKLPFVRVGSMMRISPLDAARHVAGPFATDDQVDAIARERITLIGPERRPPGVYLIETTEPPHRVKIGYSEDPDRRLLDLLVGSPLALRIRKVVPGSLADERALQERFLDSWIRGEWYNGDAVSEIEQAMEEING